MSISLITHQDDKGGLLYNHITYLWRKFLKMVSLTLMDVSTLTIKNNKKLSIFVLLLLWTHIWCTELQSWGRIHHSSGENLAHKSAERLWAAQLLQHPGVSGVNPCATESWPGPWPHLGLWLVGLARRLAPAGGATLLNKAQSLRQELFGPNARWWGWKTSALFYFLFYFLFLCLWETSAFCLLLCLVIFRSYPPPWDTGLLWLCTFLLGQ